MLFWGVWFRRNKTSEPMHSPCVHSSSKRNALSLCEGHVYIQRMAAYALTYKSSE